MTTPAQSSTTDTSKKSATDEQLKAAADTARQESLDLQKISLAHVTAKVADGPDTGVQAGQVASQGLQRADTEIASTAAVTKIRPDVVAAFKEEIRSKILELATQVEAKIREITRQRETPSRITQDNNQLEKDIKEKRQDLELFAGFSQNSGGKTA